MKDEEKLGLFLFSALGILGLGSVVFVTLGVLQEKVSAEAGRPLSWSEAIDWYLKH